LHVDWIDEIVWNKQAFQDLVVDEETKELVQALVTKQLVAQKSTDSISGKRNGLIYSSMELQEQAKPSLQRV
jgi:hypothetical protein